MEPMSFDRPECHSERSLEAVQQAIGAVGRRQAVSAGATRMLRRPRLNRRPLAGHHHDKPMRKKLIWRSLLSTACGWITGNLCFIAYASVAWGRFTNVEVVIFWTIPFVVLGWLFFFLPLILVIDRRNAFFSLPAFTLAGAAIGTIAFLFLVGWWAPLWEQSYAYLIHPAVTGGVAAAVYSATTRIQRPQAG